MKRIALFPFSVPIVLLASSPLFAQWEPDRRLTFADSLSQLCDNNAWGVAASGNMVHVAWEDSRDGQYEIYYLRSTDSGTTWDPEIRLTNAPYHSRKPCIAASDSNVHVVWQDLRDLVHDGYVEIYYKRSQDNGTTWGSDTRLSIDDSLYSSAPSLAVSGPALHVVWMDYRNRSFSQIYYKRTTDGGTTWSPDTRLSNNLSGGTYAPSVAVSGLDVHVAWHDYRDGNSEVYFKRSQDGGLTWEPDVRLTYDTAQAQITSIATSGSDVHIVWHQPRDGFWQIFYKRSQDGGTTWGPDTLLTDDPAYSWWPNIAVSGRNVHIVWYSYMDGPYEIYYIGSTDGGTSWGPITRLTNDPSISYNPSIAVSGTKLHVVWEDGRAGNYEIYYKGNPTGNSGVEEKSKAVIEKLRAVLQATPNPFISFTIVPGYVKEDFILYDVSGRKVGVYKGNRVGEGLPAGVYFLRPEGKDAAPLRIVKLR